MKRRPSHLGRLRAAAGLSQGKVAEMLGRHQTQVSHWERGACAPNPTDTATLAQLYGVSEAVITEAVRREALAYPARLLRQRRKSCS